MAIMRRCCCFSDTRSGTLACTIYSMIYAAISCALAGWGLNIWILFGGIVVAMYCIEIVAFALVVVSSIIGIVGVSKDVAPMLLPYIISVILMMVVELVSYIVWLSILGFAAIVLILPFIIFLLFVALNIVCVLCVVSQYQELRAGRGRLEDVMAARTTTTTVVMTGGQVVTQYPPPGTFVVAQQPAVQGVQPGYAQPNPAQPGYVQPGYSQPGYVQPGYSQPGYAQPTEPPPPLDTNPGEVVKA